MCLPSLLLLGLVKVHRIPKILLCLCRCSFIWPRLLHILKGHQDRNGVHGKLQPGACGHPALASPAPTPHFCRQRPGHPGSQCITCTDKARTSPGPNPSNLLRGSRPWPPSLPFCWPDRSLPLSRPLTSIRQTPHFSEPYLAAS